MSPSNELRILCFGASITAGFHAFGFKHHPYVKQLSRRLQEAFPFRKITIDIDALSGDKVIGGQYHSRLNPHFLPNSQPKYDWVIFQGGGNDLGWGRDPNAIFDALKNHWSICLNGNAKVMALTVTETSDQSRRTRERYDKLNELIKNHEAKNLFVADVCDKVPYAVMDDALRKKVWDDGLHFKPAGYDLLGDAIADRMLEILQRSHFQEKL
ncbi:MAG: hypothetical protein Q9219_005140 [cf. Caloplaca sp. 3 TL-2023]